MASGCSAAVDVGVSPQASPTDAGDGADSSQSNMSSASASVDTSDSSRVDWSEGECAFDRPEGVETTCGWLTVPEHWDDPEDEGSIRLHVGMFSAGDTDTDPVVYLEGGPGGDALANIGQGFDVLFGELVLHHDIVVLGQRGTGSAEPTLKCGGVAELDLDLLARPANAQEELTLYSDAYAECAEEFEAAGIDPAAYNSVENAHDVDALREALGFEQWNLLGISYGTRLAQSVMRLHPEGVRSAVLDSVLATEREPNVDIPQVAERAFGELFTGCAESVECEAMFPDLEERFFALVSDLDEAPRAFTIMDPVSSEQYPAVLDGQGLLELGFGALYSQSRFAGLPEVVAQLERGDMSGVSTLMSQEVASWPFIADGMYWSVQCNEEIPFLDAQSVVEGRADDPRYNRLTPPESLAFFDSVCDSLDAGVAPPEEDQLLVSEIPALLLAGSYDPITPPSDTASLETGLANSTYVELPHTGHAALVDPCAQGITVAFLEDPASPVDASCVDEVAEPPWVPDLFADIAFEPFEFASSFASGSGVAPVGWEQGIAGTFVNSDNLLHLSVILQQAVEDVPADFFADSLVGVFGGGSVEEPDVVAGGRTWSHQRIDIPGSVIDLFARDEGDTALLVLFQHAPADRRSALQVLTEPILSAFGPA